VSIVTQFSQPVYTLFTPQQSYVRNRTASNPIKTITRASNELIRKWQYTAAARCRDFCVSQWRRRRFRIDTEVRCVGAHPLFWPLEPARVKPN